MSSALTIPRGQTILMISVCTILLPITTGTQKIVGVNECTENLQSRGSSTDPQKEHQREEYFYSLLLLFVPFKNEASLLKESETAEEAFNHLLSANDNCSAYHARLLKAHHLTLSFIIHTKYNIIIIYIHTYIYEFF